MRRCRYGLTVAAVSLSYVSCLPRPDLAFLYLQQKDELVIFFDRQDLNNKLGHLKSNSRSFRKCTASF